MAQVQDKKGTRAMTRLSGYRLGTISSPGHYSRKGLLIMVRWQTNTQTKKPLSYLWRFPEVFIL